MQEPDNAVTLQSLFSHGRRVFTGELLFYYPYGNATSKNILENYLGTPEIYTNVVCFLLTFIYDDFIIITKFTCF